MATRRAVPFEVHLSDAKRAEFTHWLCDEVQRALDARAATATDLDYWWSLYEQARTRLAKTTPWPDAADLTSFLGTEKVDALHARLMRTVWTEPLWTVEGWGESAARAPFVEEFHQWKAEEERLQTVLDRLALNALIEPRALLEVREGTDLRVTRVTRRVALEHDALTGAPVFEADGTPAYLRDPVTGEYVDAPDDPQIASAEITVDQIERVRVGPQYRVLPYADSLILPGHARDKEEIWGYGKRFWKRLPLLQNAAKAGLYDRAAVDRLTQVGEREQTAALSRANQVVAPQDGPTAEKELWELLVLATLDRSGERWYLATIHLGQRELLRLQHDDLERSRFIPVILFPRPDRVTEGWSFLGHKLITVIEEHTAWRNMIADRASMAVNAPITRLQGALWDPELQPFGPKAVIDVRDHRELSRVEIGDVPPSAIERERSIIAAAERLAGINDVALGVNSAEDRTLGEVNLVAQQSFVRMDLVIRRFQEAMEDLAQIRHEIWKRVLASMPNGMPAPHTVLLGLETRGAPTDEWLPSGRVTAHLLEGVFRFKPRGSVETADLARLRTDFVAFLGILPRILQAFPSLITALQTPQAAKAIWEHAMRVFRVPNKQAFLGPTPSAMPPPAAGMPPSLTPGVVPPPPPGGPPLPTGPPPQPSAEFVSSEP
jgi:hypothetical protein